MANLMHNPRKRFGQNFLHDQGVIAQILANLNAKPGEHWLEIGPGQGALTAPLLAKGVILDVVELDRDLVALLQRKFNGYPHLSIHSADALKFDFTQLAKPGEKLRVVGNLPYNISTPLLFHLLETTDCMADMVFMLQKEVVDRICAAPGNKQYGRLSIMMQYYCQAECLFDVHPESFDPIPQVMSSIVRLTPYDTQPVVVKDKALFDKIVAQAFSQRRKTLRNSLKTLVNDDVFTSLGIDPGARAETISLSCFAELSNSLLDNPGTKL
jgi:16S rRNA (adenine1518-N6/adenine1519-N6)-dimethyltransferase